MSISEKLIKIASNEQATIELNKRIGQAVTNSNATLSENADNIEQLNANLEQTLYGTDTGGKSYYDEFWDGVQWRGQRTIYQYGFYRMVFSPDFFKPKYDIAPVGDVTSMFGGGDTTLQVELGQVDMEDVEKKCGIKFDFSKCTYMPSCFASSLFKTLNVIDISNVTNGTSYLFYDGYSPSSTVGRKTRINRLIVSENTVFQSNSFGYCTMLEYIGFEGTLAKNGLTLQASKKLNKESMVSLIGILSSETSALTVTLSLTAVNNAFETSVGLADGSTSTEWVNLIATKPNWTISLV